MAHIPLAGKCCVPTFDSPQVWKTTPNVTETDGRPDKHSRWMRGLRARRKTLNAQRPQALRH